MKNLTQQHKNKFAIPFFSLVILFFLGFQLYTAIHWREFWPKFRRLQAPYKLLKPPKDPSLWPFMSYPMYSYPNYRGDTIKQYAVFATLTDKSEVRILPEDLGLNYWIFMYGFKQALRQENYQDILNYVEIYEKKQNKKVVDISLNVYPLEVWDAGLIEKPLEMVKKFRIEELKDNQ